MALTFPRWILAVCVGCVLAVAGLPPRTVHAPSFPNTEFEGAAATTSADSLRQWRYNVIMTSSSIAGRLRDMTIRDSVLAAVRPAADTGLSVFAGLGVSPGLRDQFSAIVAGEWKALGQPAPRVPVIAAIVLDTATEVRGNRRKIGAAAGFATFLPAELGRNVCLAVVELHDRHALSGPPSFGSLRLAAFTDHVLGQCAYVGAFGVPGSLVNRWLAYNSPLAASAHWGVPTRSVARPDRAEDQFQDLDRFERTSSSAARVLLNDDEVACAAGVLAQCAAAILGRVPSPGSPLGADEAERERLGNERAQIWGSSSAMDFGPQQASLLSDMVHDLGPSTFGEVWRSPRPLPDAFAAAAHETLSEWTRGWVQRVYGVERVGPSAPLSSTLEVLGLGLIGVGVAIGVGSRRSVG